VPLASAALELLSQLPRRTEFVLPAGKGSRHYTGLQKDWERVRERAGLAGVRVTTCGIASPALRSRMAHPFHDRKRFWATNKPAPPKATRTWPPIRFAPWRAYGGANPAAMTGGAGAELVPARAAEWKQ